MTITFEQIVLDVDGPLILDKTHEFFEYAINNGYQWNYITYLKTGSWETATGLNRSEIGQIYSRFLLTCSDEFKVTPGARDCISKLAQFQLLIATTRCKSLQVFTTEFLSRAFGRFDGYHFGHHDGKIEIIKRGSAIYFIEDNIQLAQRAAKETSAIVILFPARGRVRSQYDLGAINHAPEAENVSEDPLDENWADICTRAWQLISSIISQQ